MPFCSLAKPKLNRQTDWGRDVTMTPKGKIAADRDEGKLETANNDANAAAWLIAIPHKWSVD